MLGKVLVTGGFGNLGTWVTRTLIDLGYEVSILTRKEQHKIAHYDYHIIEADISNVKSLKEKLNNSFDYCIHLASYNEFFDENYADNSLSVNTIGTRNLLKSLDLKNLKKFIYLSTVHVYGEKEGLVREDDVLSPQNDYAMTHLFAEYYVKQFGIISKLNYAILRLSNSYGVPTFKETNKWYLVINNLVRQAYESQKIILNTNGNSSRDFIWMGDVSQIICKILSVKQNTIYNLSSRTNYKMIEIAKMVQDVYMDKYHKKIPIELNIEDTREYKESFIDNSRLQKEIVYTMHNKLKEEINNIFDLLESNT